MWTHRPLIVAAEDPGMSIRTRLRTSPVLVTFLLAPVVGELLSSSTPLPAFLVGWLPMALLYGCGVLLVREFAVRWRRGWLGIALLGAAYGIVEEGLVTRAFFDPNWEDLGALATFGSDAGVNWLWALQLTIYHAAISVGVTLLLDRLLFPDRWEEPWLTKRSMRWCFAGVGVWIVIGFFLYRPPAGYLVATAIIVGLLVAAARIVPRRAGRPGRVPRPRRVFLAGLVGSTIVMLAPHVLAEVPGADPGFAAVLIVGTVAILAWRIRRWAAAGWDDRHRFALVAGELATFVVLAPVFTGSPWAAVTSLGSAIVAWRWWRRLRHRAASSTVEVTA